MFLGGNVAALKLFRDLLSSDNTTETLAPAPLPEIPRGVKDNCYQERGNCHAHQNIRNTADLLDRFRELGYCGIRCSNKPATNQ